MTATDQFELRDLRSIRKFYELVSLGCLCLAMPVDSFGDLVFTESDDERIVSVEVGEKIFFDLSGNPSTGYSWMLHNTNGNSVVFAGESTFIADNPDMTGGGGVYQYPLQAIHSGTTYFEFHYRKAWDAQSTLKNFTITLNVVSHPSPHLTISRGEINLVLSWPITDSEGYYLEGTPSLVAPQWQALNALVRSDGTNYWVEVQPTGNATYYRLRK